jgi:S1-C subfamily serine protease
MSFLIINVALSQEIPPIFHNVSYKLININPIGAQSFEHSFGSCTAIDTSEYNTDPNYTYFLTAAHVLLDSKKKPHGTNYIKIGKTKDSLEALELIDYNVDEDVALLRIKKKYPTIKLSNEEVSIWSLILVVGAPLGTEISPTFGYLTDNWSTKWQSSAPAFEGNSGGGLFDFKRQVLIGVVSGILGDAQARIAPNICFTVNPTNIRKILNKNLKK